MITNLSDRDKSAIAKSQIFLAGEKKDLIMPSDRFICRCRHLHYDMLYNFCITNPGSKFDMDDVWSIKKNVSASGGLMNPSDGLNLKANSTYYSRYGGIKGSVSVGYMLHTCSSV